MSNNNLLKDPYENAIIVKIEEDKPKLDKDDTRNLLLQPENVIKSEEEHTTVVKKEEEIHSEKDTAVSWNNDTAVEDHRLQPGLVTTDESLNALNDLIHASAMLEISNSYYNNVEIYPAFWGDHDISVKRIVDAISRAAKKGNTKVIFHSAVPDILNGDTPIADVERIYNHVVTKLFTNIHEDKFKEKGYNTVLVMESPNGEHIDPTKLNEGVRFSLIIEWV